MTSKTPVPRDDEPAKKVGGGAVFLRAGVDKETCTEPHALCEPHGHMLCSSAHAVQNNTHEANITYSCVQKPDDGTTAFAHSAPPREDDTKNNLGVHIPAIQTASIHADSIQAPSIHASSAHADEYTAQTHDHHAHHTHRHHTHGHHSAHPSCAHDNNGHSDTRVSYPHSPSQGDVSFSLLRLSLLQRLAVVILPLALLWLAVMAVLHAGH
jgi:hypothetical protein